MHAWPPGVGGWACSQGNVRGYGRDEMKLTPRQAGQWTSTSPAAWRGWQRVRHVQPNGGAFRSLQAGVLIP